MYPLSCHSWRLTGVLTIKDLNAGTSEVRGVAPSAHSTHSTLIPAFAHITAGKDGAVYVLVQILSDSYQGPFSTMSQVISSNGLPNKDGIDEAARGIELPFVRVDKTDWGIAGGRKSRVRVAYDQSTDGSYFSVE